MLLCTFARVCVCVCVCDYDCFAALVLLLLFEDPSKRIPVVWQALSSAFLLSLCIGPFALVPCVLSSPQQTNHTCFLGGPNRPVARAVVDISCHTKHRPRQTNQQMPAMKITIHSWTKIRRTLRKWFMFAFTFFFFPRMQPSQPSVPLRTRDRDSASC